jgi:Zn-dependent protease with chaperone function
MGTAKLALGLLAVVLGHAAYVFFIYRARVLTHSPLASSDFIVFALPALLAFGGFYWLLRGRKMHLLPPWVAAFLLTLLSLWLNLLLPFNVYGT